MIFCACPYCWDLQNTDFVQFGIFKIGFKTLKKRTLTSIFYFWFWLGNKTKNKKLVSKNPNKIDLTPKIIKLVSTLICLPCRSHFYKEDKCKGLITVFINRFITILLFIYIACVNVGKIQAPSR